MKKFKLMITVAVLAVISYSCNNSAVQRMADKMTPDPVVLEQEGAGFFSPQPEEKFVVASDDVTDVWMKYIDAHNNGDVEAIMAMESDSIYIMGPEGAVIKGKEAHAAFLKVWFETANPKWNVYWAMPYIGVTGGEEWIIAGHNTTSTVDGVKTSVLDMIDANIKDGMVQKFWVYQNQGPSEDASEEEASEETEE
tara:strand:- start:392 stop:976 length:585 start_codon:yes stop_codon:yes gene_type:complete